MRVSLIISEDLWHKLSILAIDKKTSKNKLITELIQKGLKE